MAARRNYNSYNYNNYNNYRSGNQSYVYGNVVTKPAYEPERRVREPEPEKRVSRQVRQNRRKAQQMSPGYVMFLTFAAVIALVVCINYVKLQAGITSSSKTITAMQSELAELREENNTRYNSVMDTVNLEEVRSRAAKLGMVYATADQIVSYDSPSSDYVKQYEAIPEDGVIAQSDKNKE